MREPTKLDNKSMVYFILTLYICATMNWFVALVKQKQLLHIGYMMEFSLVSI